MYKNNYVVVLISLFLATVSGSVPALDVQVKAFATGLQSPVDLKEVPDGSGRIFIMQQTGAIVVVNADGTVRPESFLDLRAKSPQL